MSYERELAESFAAIGARVVTSDDLVEVLASITRLATRTIDTCEHAGVTVFTEGRLDTPPSSDPVSATMDQLQVEADEGPCMDAARSVYATETSDLRHDERWPALVARLDGRTPVRSVLSERLRVGDRTLGAINFYATTPDAFDDNDRAAAPVFAAYAGLALFAARNRQELTRALETRDVIGQAKGILMARHGCDEDAAFDLLRETSMRLNRKLRELAQDVVDQAVHREDPL